MLELPTLPRIVLLTGAMAILAGLDFGGALLAKHWADHGNRISFMIGLLLFLVLYVVYATSLKTAELSVVTMGWVVLLQVGLILVDRFRYDVNFSTGKWMVVVAILLLQAYLILDPFADKAS